MALPDSDDAAFRLTLRMGESSRPTEVRVPTRPLNVVELLPVLQSFNNAVVELAETETHRQGKAISCCAGCGACCRQLVPISEPEAIMLARVVEAMPEPRRSEIRRRFDAALEALDKAGVLDRAAHADQIPDEATRGELGLAYFAVGTPCPFLENESCGIYPDRPLACREFLVTSPAEECRRPGPDNIVRVPLPAALSERFYRFSASGETQKARWMPLVMALRFAAEHAGDKLPQSPGHELFKKFLAKLRPS